jgi:hypothetical protein
MMPAAMQGRWLGVIAAVIDSGVVLVNAEFAGRIPPKSRDIAAMRGPVVSAHAGNIAPHYLDALGLELDA